MLSKNISLMENHNDALLCWIKACQKNKILVHVDAHFDFAWIADKDPHEILNAKTISDFKRLAKENLFWNISNKKKDELTHIGNYIYPAIKEDIVREFYWVVPDSVFSGRQRLSRFKKEIDDIIKSNPEEKHGLRLQGDYLETKICDIRLVICRLRDLPKFEEDVLLDIDVDYFIAQEKLWLEPAQFIKILEEKGLKSDLVTIAYSVEGGFTPIGYKFIGDYLAYLFNGRNQGACPRMFLSGDKNPPRPEGAPPLEKGGEGGFDRAVSLIIQAIDAKSHEDAIHFLKEAENIYPDCAAIYFHLSNIYYETGLKKEAKDYYHKAVSQDPSYRTLYNNKGPLFENRGRLKDAEDEYKKMLELDPDNPQFLTRLGNIYRKKKKWDDAMFNYNRALKIDPNNEESFRNIGYIHMIKNDMDKAVEDFKKALSLKPDNPFTHSYLGLAHIKKKDYNEAMRETRRAINSGLFTYPPLRWRLVFIYFKKGLYDRLLDELKAAFTASYFNIFWRVKAWLRY
ncbi:MAG: UPF0489 family protein [Deltaproteobacteria bacterium]|nr:UPF0489 family protein [Deltaproteobacteria bacterium]